MATAIVTIGSYTNDIIASGLWPPAFEYSVDASRSRDPGSAGRLYTLSRSRPIPTSIPTEQSIQINARPQQLKP